MLVPLFDCASAPITVNDKLTHSSSRIKPFLEVNKLVLSKLNTHNLYVMLICMTKEISRRSSSTEGREKCCKYYLALVMLRQELNPIKSVSSIIRKRRA